MGTKIPAKPVAKPVTEPVRDTSEADLEPGFRSKLNQLLARMRTLGFTPAIYETRRSEARQAWLFGVGRTHDMDRKPVTWTMHSQHLPDANGLGQAADIIDAHSGWDNPRFFDTLALQAHAVGLYTIPEERCHIQLSNPHG